MQRAMDESLQEKEVQLHSLIDENNKLKAAIESKEQEVYQVNLFILDRNIQFKPVTLSLGNLAPILSPSPFGATGLSSADFRAV